MNIRSNYFKARAVRQTLQISKNFDSNKKAALKNTAFSGFDVKN